jgi:hypothetical protein
MARILECWSLRTLSLSNSGDPNCGTNGAQKTHPHHGTTDVEDNGLLRREEVHQESDGAKNEPDAVKNSLKRALGRQKGKQEAAACNDTGHKKKYKINDVHSLKFQIEESVAQDPNQGILAAPSCALG